VLTPQQREDQQRKAARATARLSGAMFNARRSGSGGRGVQGGGGGQGGGGAQGGDDAQG
jgi:hypothetical protein